MQTLISKLLNLINKIDTHWQQMATNHCLKSTRFPLFYQQKKIQDFTRTPTKNFPGPFRSQRMFKYNVLAPEI